MQSHLDWFKYLFEFESQDRHILAKEQVKQLIEHKIHWELSSKYFGLHAH